MGATVWETAPPISLPEKRLDLRINRSRILCVSPELKGSFVSVANSKFRGLWKTAGVNARRSF